MNCFTESARSSRLFEPYVREIITLGTPIIGGPKYTSVANRFAKIAKLDLDEFEQEVHERNSIGIKQPVTSIYSKADGVVGWKASIDIYNKQARNMRVNSSHFRLGANGEVIATSDDTVVVEGNHYFPRSSVNDSFLKPSSRTSVCPWKGTASYYTLSVDDNDNPDAAWYYERPKDAAKQIAGRVAFWNGVQVVE